MKFKTMIFMVFYFILIGINSFSQDNIIQHSDLMEKSEFKIYQLSDTTLAAFYFAKGDSLALAAQYDSSNYYFNKAKSVYSFIINKTTAEDQLKNVLSCDNKIGWTLMMMEKYDEAMNCLTSNLKIGLNKYGDTILEVAQCYNNIGTLYRNKGNPDSSLANYQNSLLIRLKILGENNLSVAESYNNIAIIYWHKGDLEKALEIAKKSLSIKLKISGETKFDVGDTYNIIGIIYMNKGDYDEAIGYYQKAVSVWQKLLGKEHSNLAHGYNNIGIAHYYKGEFDQSLEYYQKAYLIWRKTSGENSLDVAYVFNNIGIIYAEKEDYDEALQYFQKEIEIRVPIIGEYNTITSISYSNFGDLYAKKGDYKQAVKYYNKALTIGLKVLGNYHPLIAGIYESIAKIDFINHNFNSALKNCQLSLASLVSNYENRSIYTSPTLDQINSEPQLLSTLSLKAKVLESLSAQSNGNGIDDNMNFALSTYKLADELIDKIRIGYNAESSKLLFDEKALLIYDDAIQICLKLYASSKDENYKQQAFYFAEKSKSAVLQEALTEVQAKQFANIPADLLDLEKQLKNDLALNETQLQTELQKNDSYDSIKVSQYQNRLFDLKTNYYQLIKKFEDNYPAYYNLKYKTNTATVHELQNRLPNNSVLLEYFIGDSTIYIFSITKKLFNIVSVEKPGEFSQLVKDFYTSVVKAETDEYLSSANRLSKLIVEPIKNELTSKKNLVIIPHNELYKIPFEALLMSEEDTTRTSNQIDFSTLNYLIKSFNISYNYSASLYINNLNEQAEAIGKTKQLKSFVGFAPVFSDDDTTGFTLGNKNLHDSSDEKSDSLLRSVVLDDKKFSELKYSEWEVKSILELFTKAGQGTNSLAFFHADASKDNFKCSINNYRIIHIASHSFINELQPKISGIVFAQTNDSLEADGILYAGEIYNLELNADLVVLSSCESGLGKLIRGEGMMALTRGFLYSGASNVLFSLWKVPDKHTSELMIDFYKQMLSGNNYSESLRNAKLKLISNPTSARPRSWASFLLIGSDI